MSDQRAVPGTGWQSGSPNPAAPNPASPNPAGPNPAAPNPLAVDLKGLHKAFGSVEAVRGIDLEITTGEIVAFLGPNGAGKTSTIDMILGLSRPSAGQVSVFGMSPRQPSPEGWFLR